LPFAIYYAVSAPEGGPQIEMLRLSVRSLFSLEHYFGVVFVLTDQATLPHLEGLKDEVRDQGEVFPVVVADRFDPVRSVVRARYWLPRLHKELNKLAGYDIDTFLYLDADILSVRSFEGMFFACSDHGLPILCCGENGVMCDSQWWRHPDLRPVEEGSIRKARLAGLNSGQFWVSTYGFDILNAIDDKIEAGRLAEDFFEEQRSFNLVVFRRAVHNVALSSFFALHPFGSSSDNMPFLHFCGAGILAERKVDMMRAAYEKEMPCHV
jgi:hypothetical protein